MRSSAAPSLELRQDVREPHAGPGEIRIRVAVVWLEPDGSAFAAMPVRARGAFSIALPSGFGYDFAGVELDEVGHSADGFTVVTALTARWNEPPRTSWLMNELTGADDTLSISRDRAHEVARPWAVAGATASAALGSAQSRAGWTQSWSAAQRRRRRFGRAARPACRATVIGRRRRAPSRSCAIGAVVAYGAGLDDRVRVSAATASPRRRSHLFGTETIKSAPRSAVDLTASSPSPPA